MNKKILFSSAIIFALLLGGMLQLNAQNVTTYKESFDQNNTAPSGWVLSNNLSSNSQTAFWLFGRVGFRQPAYNLSGTTDHTGNSGNYAWVDGDFPYNITCFMETKSFDFKNHWKMKFEFWLKNYNASYSPSLYGKNTFNVDYYDGMNWHFKVYTQNTNNSTASWTKKSIDLSQWPPVGTQQVKFRFTVIKNVLRPYTNDIVMDDFAVSGEEAMVGGNNTAALGSKDETICPGAQDINVLIQNRGNNQVDSVEVHWMLDGVAQPMVKHKGLLDTLTGTKPSSAIVTLGNDTFKMGVYRTIKYWTSMPNGVADTINDNDTNEFKLGGALNGIITVGGAGDDFATLDTVAWLLNNIGICAPTTIRLHDKSFVESLVLDRVPGNTSVNTITFESKGGNRANCLITDTTKNAVTNYTIILDTVSFITFKNISVSNGSINSFAGVVDLRSNPHHVKFDNCKFFSNYSGSSTNAYLVNSAAKDIANNVTFEGCMFENGSVGIWIEGEKNNYQSKWVLKNNTFKNNTRTSVRMKYINEVSFTSNTFNSNSTTTQMSAISLDETTGFVEIYGNHIMRSKDWPTYGIFVKNSIGNSTKKNSISTNSISIGDSLSTDSKRGIILDNASFFDVTSNSVSLESNNASSAAFLITNSSGNNILNNVFANMSPIGAAVSVSGLGSVLSMNNNLLYSMSDLGVFNTAKQATLSNWQSNTGFDSKSVSEDPIFRGTNDLKICSKLGDNIGTGFGLRTDFDNNLRHPVTPDPGAFEYSAISGITIPDERVCFGDTASFFVAKGATDVVIWNHTDTSQVFKTTVTGTYTLTALGVCGADTTSFQVINNDLVKLMNDTNICGGDTLMVTASLSNASYKWNNGMSTRSIGVTSNGRYIVNVVDSDACVSADTIEVTVSKTVSLRGDTSVCNGKTVELDPGTPGGSYTWSRNGVSFSTATKIFADSAGVYSLIYIDAKSCSSTDTFELNVIDIPSARFTWTQNQSNIQFTADDKTGTNYFWTFGDGKIDNGPAWSTLNKYAANKTNPGYSVTLVVSSAFCGDSTFTNNVPVTTIGMNELSNNSSITVFPNPSNGVINLSISAEVASKNLNVEVLSMDGKIVFKKDNLNADRTYSFDLSSSVSAGMYLIKVKSDNNIIFTNKISIK